MTIGSTGRVAPWLAGLFVAVMISGGLWEALRWGTDLEDLLLGGRRFAAAEPLYAGSTPEDGFVGPPFQALFMAPFARIEQSSRAGARVAWFAFQMAGLLVGIRAWALAVGVRSSVSLPVGLALVGVAFPLYREIQEQNLTCVLFGIFGLAAQALTRGRDRTAGAWIGAAAALKLYPGLALMYLLVRGRWRAATTGGVAAAVLTVLPIFRYGWAGSIGLVREWVRTRQDGAWPSQGINQSLAVRVAARIPGSAGVAIASAAVGILVIGLLSVAWRRRRAAAGSLADELALALGVSVLASPIAWFTYWVLTLPAFLVTAREAAAGRRMASAIFVVAACAVTVVGAIRRESPGAEYTVAGLLLVFTLGAWLWPAASFEGRGVQ